MKAMDDFEQAQAMKMQKTPATDEVVSCGGLVDSRREPISQVTVCWNPSRQLAKMRDMFQRPACAFLRLPDFLPPLTTVHPHADARQIEVHWPRPRIRPTVLSGRPGCVPVDAATARGSAAATTRSRTERELGACQENDLHQAGLGARTPSRGLQ